MCAMMLWMNLLLGADAPAIPLWQLAPFDRLTLTNGEVHDINPERIAAGVRFDDVADDVYVGQPGLPPRSEIRRPVRYRIVRQADGYEYDVHGRRIAKIELYEDMLLAEARKLLREDKFDECLRYLQAVADRSIDWPGLKALRVEYHHREGMRRKLAGDWEQAFWAFIEAEKSQKELPEAINLAPPIAEQMEELVVRWADAADGRGDFIELRRILARVKSHVPASSALLDQEKKLFEQARRIADAAKTDLDAGNLAGARRQLEQAVAVSPADPAIRAEIEKLYTQHGHLRVAVEERASFFGGPRDWSTADRRAADLIHLPMVKTDAQRDPPTWASLLLEGINRPDEFLNRRAVVQLKSGLQWSGDAKSVSVIDIQRWLARTCDASTPFYHPALARLIVGVRADLPDRLTIEFDRPQPRPEAWLAVPFVRESAAGPGLGPLRIAESGKASATYVRNDNAVPAVRPMIEQVTEIVIPKASDRLRALEENRVDLVTDLPPRQWANAERIAGARLVTFATPVVYVLQFNYEQRVLRDRTLRRAMAYAIDTAALLRDLGLDPADSALTTTAPWPAGSFGYDASIAPRKPDPLLARTLIAAVKKTYSTLPVLRLIHSASEADRIACRRLAADLERVGLRISLIEFDPAAPVSPVSVDLRYVGLVVHDPVYDAMTFLTRDNPSLAEHASPWLRQAIVDLVDVPNLTAARELLPRVQRILHDDVALLCLWQGLPRIAISHRVAGTPDRWDGVYDSLPAWSVTPGFPPDFGIAPSPGESP